MKKMKGFCLMNALLLVCSAQENFPKVKTNLGLVVGHYKKSYNGRQFSAFEGIPYAKPPLGSLRFDEPRPSEPWLGTWIANKVYTCIQPYFTDTIGHEDCLYVNVYVPKLQPTSQDNLDVVVHIHGGGFLAGDPKLAGPEFLMDREIIYINFNYRLGVLGFLSTEDNIVKGNMGLKDQVIALKWIQNNIKQFGGNPNSICLTGISAGGVSTHFHYFSPKSKGLFHRGISQSGTATAPFSIQETPLKTAKMLASSVGCEFNSTRAIRDCLRQRPANVLILNSQSILLKPGIPLVNFAPVIEKHHESAFLTEYPFHLLQKGAINDVPWITSMTSEEGIVGVLSYLQNFDYIDQYWNDVAPLLLDYSNTCSDSHKTEISEAIKQYYFNNKSLSVSTIPNFIKMFTDRYFSLDLEKSARMHAKVAKSPVYSYIYSYKEESINAEKVFGFDGDYGVNHGADGHLLYNVQFLGFNLSSSNLTKSDELMKEFLVDTVVTFAKTGNPVKENVVWQQVTTSEDFAYLSIKNPKHIAMTYQKEIAPKAFWKSLKLNEDEHYGTCLLCS